jgi:hypothetical protein
VEALDRRGANVERRWQEASRTYVVASSHGRRLFGRANADPADTAVLEYEARVRKLVGAAGPLRAPPVLERGADWSLEAGIEPEPFGGPEHVRLVAAAAAEVQELDLPEPPDRPTGGSRWRGRLRLLRSPLPLADVRKARAIVAAGELPLVTSHGDFHPGNVLLADGAAWVVDWELSGRRSAGYDLLHFSATVDRPDDRERLFEAVVELVGPAQRQPLARLRYAVYVRAIAAKLSSSRPFDRDPEGARRLLALLPGLQQEAGL